jgi:hypothetical protein
MQRLALTCLGLLTIVWSSLPAQAQSAKDELDYSASMCTPRSAEQFHGNGREGFAWDARGFWANRDTDASQTLVCPIPFDRRAVKADGSFGTIEVKVNVFDNSHLHELVARVFGTTGVGDPSGPDLQALATADNGIVGNTGARTLLLSFNPSNDMRYLWLEIVVPRVIWPDQRSTVTGYRVNRIGFN